MAQNFTLSPEDHLLWQERAPRASYWFGVSDTHPFIHGGQPNPARSDTPPPPPYIPMVPPPAPTPAPTYRPTTPMPAYQPPAPMPTYQPPAPTPTYQSAMFMPPYQPVMPVPPYLPATHLPAHPPFSNGQLIHGIAQMPHPIAATPLPTVNLVPIYDVCNQRNTASGNPSRSSLPSRKLNFNISANPPLTI